ncbi:HtaA domain-containing protein [Corynebacterium silvaticum]|uniref:HtaA domain-containing protein n=1 Tax=Corynebacterium silvaticum TaxID=2320431 RepID=A0A7Y4LHN5_9CORY|nr:HtaA domain-containing protein [Corynebacterium silvaticum]ARU46933.2 HtaA domain-containing protein [Corynebacterium silvaticum]MBH5300672.1 HtaA domain-containing protein [Corynebacterium silvaticum]UWH00175.1 HtaA domain-containing protein [Corynebacterium silvaticum]UWH02219.1 HtaA domain-containing protein [Corynebacterium silvaticum]UWH04259.1 HtaA domain-containing protein [Corynebacterium silvaticum]
MRRHTATIVATFMASSLVSLTPVAYSQDASAEGSLSWGIRSSFNNYTGGATKLSDGATRSDTSFTFPLVSQAFDESTSKLEAQFKGEVLYKKYCKNAGTKDPVEDDCSLDLSMKNPKVVIAPEGSYMEATVRSKQYTMGQYFSPEKPVRIANLYTSGAQFTDSEGKISWSDIATALTPDGVKMFSDFYNENEGLDPLGFTYKGKGVRPAGDQGGLRTAAQKWTAPKDYDRISRPFLYGEKIVIATAEYGVTLLDAELRLIAKKELPIDKLATVAFNASTGELFYAASEGSSDAKTLMKVAVSGDGIGEPTSVGTVPETIRGIGVDPDSGKFFAISAESGDDSARESGGHLTIFDKSQDKRSIALPKTAEVLGAKVIDGESVYAKIFNNDDFAEVAKMNDGTFIFHPGAAVTLEDNDIATKGFLFSIDLNASDDAFKYMKGSQYLERTALSGVSTDGETILRSTHFGRGGAQMLKYADRDVSPMTESIQLSGGELWAGSVFHDGKIVQLDGRKGNLNWLNPADLKVEKSLPITNGRETSNRRHGDFLINKNGDVYVQTLDESTGDLKEYYVLTRMTDMSKPPVAKSDNENRLKEIERREAEKTKPSPSGKIIGIVLGVLGGLSVLSFFFQNHIRSFLGL